MTDLEMVKKCAEAMGWEFGVHDSIPFVWIGGFRVAYDPLLQDGQAMALVKRFNIDLRNVQDGNARGWWALPRDGSIGAQSRDLNRAIVECVANLSIPEGRVAG